MQTDVVLIGGTIHTIDPPRPPATALAIAGNRITAVGDDTMIAALAGPATRRIELAGGTVVPGFNDAHVHLWKEGMLLGDNLMIICTLLPVRFVICCFTQQSNTATITSLS